MRHSSPHFSIPVWVVSILATLLLLPVSMLSAETTSGCENPETLETQPLVAVAQHWDAVILPSGAFVFNEETEFLNEAGDPVELGVFEPGDLVVATVCREERPTETPTPEAKPNLPVMGMLLVLQQAANTSVTPTPTPAPSPTPISATITGEIIELVNDGCLRLRPMQLEEPDEEESTESSTERQGLLVCTTSNTVIQAEDGTALTYDDLAAGNLIEVVLDISIAAPQQFAQQITVLEQDPPEPFEIEGTIEAIRPNSTNTGGHIRVMGTLITIYLNDTVITDKDDVPLVFADLMVGQRVAVTGEQDPYSFNVKATKVVVLEQEPQIIVIEGEIEELLPLDTTVCGMLRVDGILLMLSGDSQLLDAEGNRIHLSSLHVGDIARVEAIDNGMDCGLLVLKLQVVISNPPLNTITGVIAEINDADQCFILVPTWNQPNDEEVGEENKPNNRFRVCTTSETTYVDAEGNSITFADLAVENAVEVTLTPDTTSSSWTAVHVVVLPPPAPPAERITGLISEIDTTNNTIVVTPESAEKVIASITLVVNNETQIIDIRGDQLTLDELQVGDEVTAVYETGTDPTTFIAKKIVKLNVPQDPIVVEGEIKSIRSIEDSSDILSMVVENVHFLINSETNIHDTENNPVAATELKRGDRVEAIGLFEFDEKSNALVAIEITLLEAAAPPMTELKGTISEIDATNGCFEMNNELSPLAVQFNVCTNNETVIKTKDGDILAFADLEQGDRVHVVGAADTTTNAVMAKEITVLVNETPTEEITGPIREIAASENDFDLGYLLIHNNRIAVNVNTVITDKEGNELPFDALRLGQIVKVTLATDKENNVTLIAKEVVVLEEFEVVPVDFEGIIEAINSENQILVVKGTRVQINDATVILGIDGEALTIDGLEKGTFVHVNGLRNRFNHKVTALVIQVLEDPVVGPEVEIKGIISEIDLDNSQLVVNGRPVFVDENTVILNRNNQLVTLEELSVGMLVEVEGTPIPSFAPPSPIQATKIEVEKNPHRLNFQARGELTAIDADLWTVGEAQFLVVEDTNFHSADGTELTAEDFEVSDKIMVNGYKVPGETPVANSAVLTLFEEPEDVCRPNVAFSGPVEIIDTENSFLVVEGKSVLVMEYTQLIRQGEGPIALEDIAVGELAVVKAEGDANATEVTGCVILIQKEVSPPTPQEHRIVGAIDSITSDTMTLVVRDTTVQVTDETKIVARRDGELTFEDLAVGQMVDVKGRLNENEVLVAAHIRVQEENVNPRPLRPIVGLIQAIDLPTSMTVANKSVLLTDETIFQGLGDEALDPATLQVGEAVIVLLDNEASDAETDPPILVAKKVKLIANVIEAIDLALAQITVDGTPIAVVDETTIVDFPREPITLEDLSVGDLVKVRLFDTEPFPREASHIIRIAAPDLSERIGNMGEIIHGRDRGRPTITSTDPENSFGYISMPLEMAAADANTLYELKMNVATTETDPDKIPAFRARVNMANYEKASSLVVNSRGSYAYAPTQEGRDYGLLFMPPAELEVENESEAFFFASLDLLSFEPRFGRDVTLILNSLDVQPIAADRINSVQTLLLDEFVAGTDGWTFGSGGDMDLPRHGTESGTLSMGPVSNNCFGFWMKDTGITVKPGTVYRARFLISTNIDAAEQVPTFRLRLNTSNYELAATATIEPTGNALETLQPEARLYDIYLIIPEIDPGTDTILASLDLMGFRSETDLDSVITLEQFLLEEVEVTD